MKDFINEIGHEILAFTRMFNFIKDLVFLMEANEDSFRYVYVNQSAMKVLNIDGNIIGSLIEDQVPHEIASTMISKYREAQLTKKTVNFIEILESDHDEFIGEASLNPILSENGQCKYILAIVRDVTDRKREERELKETKNNLEKNQKRLNSLVENNGDAVYEMDLQGNLISINNMFTVISGYGENEIVGSSFVPLIIEEYLEETLAYFKKSLEGSREEYETWIRSKEGHLVQLLVKNVPIIVDETIIGIYGIASDITEKNRYGRLLKESEQKYKSLFENHPDAIISYDLEGKFTSGNDGVETITGYSRQEFVEKSFEEMMTPDDLERTRYHFYKAIGEKKTESFEVSILHKEGYQVNLFIMSIPIIIEDQVIGVFGLAKDVTEVNRIQETLIETKEELEVFWNYTIDPIYYFSEEKIKKVNPAFEKTFGYSEKEVAENIELIVPPTMIHEIKEINEKILKGETITSHETKRKTKNGEILDLIASYTPVKDEHGNVVGATGFYKDVSVLKGIDKELQASQEKYRLITENAFDIIKLMSKSGIVEYVSPSNESILGYSYEEYVGQPFTTYIHPEDIPNLEIGFKRIIRGAKPLPYELRVLHKNGHYLWMEASTTPIVENGEVKQLVTIARDITERKKHREDLAKMAFYDYLTGLPNRRTFDERFNMAILQANRTNKKVAIMMLDGREFKKINDSYGHDAGDAVLKEMAKRLKVSVRQTDTVARLGGDEMGIILPEIETIETAEDVAQRIIDSFKEPLFFNDNEISIGAGIGIAFYPDHSIVKKQLIKYADEALYEAKKSKQNQYMIYQ
jgi:diguanylate cyclase (GGDEF)-like protein/PAS domain S-box-containing protein